MPLQAGAVAVAVGGQVEELKTLLKTQREHAAAVDRLLDDNAFALAADPTKPSGLPDRESVAPALDFAALDAAVTRLANAARAFDFAAGVAPDIKQAARADVLLQSLEQSLTDERGLPGRPWYKHLLYAPGLLTGYGAKTLPGVREAIEGRRWDEAREFIARTAVVLNAHSARLDDATKTLAK